MNDTFGKHIFFEIKSNSTWRIIPPMISLLHLFFFIVVVILVLWVFWWTDFILYWSDPIIVPPETFLQFQTETKKCKKKNFFTKLNKTKKLASLEVDSQV
jgi:hypothetical protein